MRVSTTARRRTCSSPIARPRRQRSAQPGPAPNGPQRPRPTRAAARVCQRFRQGMGRGLPDRPGSRLASPANCRGFARGADRSRDRLTSRREKRRTAAGNHQLARTSRYEKVDGIPTPRPHTYDPWPRSALAHRRTKPLQTATNKSGRPDLNRGPHRPERCALPGCATPRMAPVSHSATNRRTVTEHLPGPAGAPVDFRRPAVARPVNRRQAPRRPAPAARGHLPPCRHVRRHRRRSTANRR